MGIPETHSHISEHSIYYKGRITNQWQNNDCPINGAGKIDYLYGKTQNWIPLLQVG